MKHDEQLEKQHIGVVGDNLSPAPASLGPDDLVMIRRKKAVCDSLQVARHFEKRHDNVLRDIENIIIDLSGEASHEMMESSGADGKNHSLKLRSENSRGSKKISSKLRGSQIDVKALFTPSSYFDSYQREQRSCLMNRDSFTLLAMGFTGQKALEWKWKYIQAFNQMEQLLAEKQTLLYQGTRDYQKAIRKQETDVIDQFIRYARGQGSRNAGRYYTNLSNLANRTAGITNRDLSTMEQLQTLAIVERLLMKCIDEGIRQGKPYKAVYEGCKERLGQFKAVAYMD